MFVFVILVHLKVKCVCVCVLMLHYVCGVGEQSSLPVYRTLFLSTLNLSAAPQGAHRLQSVSVCVFVYVIFLR